jgi:AcrR family transcriptional regulator
VTGQIDQTRTILRPNPLQRRSVATVDRILAATAALLDEVGFDRLNTNLICERSALTPPALYRHFPNKYAVMAELGRRLMEAQNEALYRFVAAQPDALVSAPVVSGILQGQHALTCSQPGGRWIMRLLHSTPELIHVRLESHRIVASYLAQRHQATDPLAPADQLARRYRMAVDTGYAMMELLLDQPELDNAAVFADAATMIAALFA